MAACQAYKLSWVLTPILLCNQTSHTRRLPNVVLYMLTCMHCKKLVAKGIHLAGSQPHQQVDSTCDHSETLSGKLVRNCLLYVYAASSQKHIGNVPSLWVDKVAAPATTKRGGILFTHSQAAHVCFMLSPKELKTMVPPVNVAPICGMWWAKSGGFSLMSDLGIACGKGWHVYKKNSRVRRTVTTRLCLACSGLSHAASPSCGGANVMVCVGQRSWNNGVSSLVNVACTDLRTFFPGDKQPAKIRNHSCRVQWKLCCDVTLLLSGVVTAGVIGVQLFRTICVHLRCPHFSCEMWCVLSLLCVVVSCHESAIVALQKVVFITVHSLRQKFLSHYMCSGRSWVNCYAKQCKLLCEKKKEEKFKFRISLILCTCDVVLLIHRALFAL